MTAKPRLGADGLRALVAPRSAADAGCSCASLVCPGWESISAPLGPPLLEHLGSLRDPADEDPTLTEFHPAGTNYWSSAAPIAVAFFPYNRCDAWRCPRCHRGFLQYTEYGGYYVDHRLREIDPAQLA